MQCGCCADKVGSVPVVFAVVEEDFFAGFDGAEGFEAGGFPAAGDDEEGIGFVIVVDEAGVVGAFAFAVDDVGATDPEYVGVEGAIFAVEFFFVYDFTGVVTDGVAFFDADFAKEALAGALDGGFFDLEGVFGPFGWFGHWEVAVEVSVKVEVW